MCVVCGCGTPDPSPERPHAPGPVGSVAPRSPTPRSIQLEADVLGANQRVAERNRAHFGAHGITALNLLSSPGSGKTTLLCATIERWRARQPQRPLGVIEGDQQTSLDAERIRASGAAAVQVNTGKGCHLDAQMVAEAFAQLPLHDHHHHHAHAHDHAHGHAHEHVHGHAHAPDHPGATAAPRSGCLVLIENVGNLVCPALWDLGEAAKVVILSVTEGEDKPLKYPDMFAAARLLLINKIDLLPHVSFDVARSIAYARRVNPAIEVLQVSATRGDGLDDWLRWLERLAP